MTTNQEKMQVCLAAARLITAGYRAQAPADFDGYSYIGTIATIATILAAATSISTTAYAATQSGPQAPNLASSSRRVAQAQANALPTQRALAAAEQQGGTASQWVPTHKEPTQYVRITEDDSKNINNQILGDAIGVGAGIFNPFGDDHHSKLIEYHAEDWQPGGKYYQAGRPENWVQNHLVMHGKPIQGHQQGYDFSGYGTADIEGELARQMADVNERLGAKYGTQFAEEARKEAELADPQGFAARDKELELIQKGIDNPLPINPMASTLDARMKSRLEAGSGLDDMSRNLLDLAMARSNADRGGATSSGDVASNMSTGMEGSARRQGAIGQAQNWLSSGATPEDVEYRREQQNLGNLGAFLQGQTPQSQFANLSGAGNGAAPFFPGQPGPGMPNNAAGVGSNYGVAGYLAGLRNQQNSANPWMAGLTSLLSGIGSLANSGSQPGTGGH